MRILVIDDKIESFREALADALPEHELRCAPDGRAGVFYLEQDAGVDLVLLDIKMPPTLGEIEEREGIETLRELRKRRPDLPVIMLSVFQEIDLVIEAIQLGAYYYLVKPLDVEKLRAAVARALDEATAHAETAHLRGALSARDQLLDLVEPSTETRLGNLVGRSEPMRRLFALIQQVAPSDYPVLVTGESGTGKELVAEELHRQSARAAKRRVTVNTAAIPHELLESEMFGHRKGSFTGAVADKAGQFELADGGTIFLDEIGDMPGMLQAKLLRVLQNRYVQRIGESEGKQVDFRLVCATHRDLPALAREGKFREDLYYRINVFPLSIPPLRERPEDIEILAEHFLSGLRKSEKSEKSERSDRSPQLSAEARAALQSHAWPGNARELENVIKRAALLAGSGPILAKHLVIEREAGSTDAHPSHGATTMTKPVTASTSAASVSAAGQTTHAATHANAPTTLWERVRAGDLKVTDLGEFKKEHGEAGLREVLLNALRETTGIYGKAMVLIGYADDPGDAKKSAAFRQTLKRMGLTTKER